MSANSATFRVDAAPTDFTVAAGTNATYTPDGVDIPNGLHLADAGETDFRVRSNITLKTRNPQLVNGIFTKGKRWATFVQPKILADDSIVYNVVRIEVEAHPECSTTEVEALVSSGAQLLVDADFTSFLLTGSLS
jgi:hypothetical protein